MTGDNAIVVKCACGKAFKAPASAAGKKARCPGCGATLVIGGARTAVAAAPPRKPAAAASAVEARPLSPRPAPARVARPPVDNAADDLDALNELAEQASTAPVASVAVAGGDDDELALAPDPTDSPSKSTRRPVPAASSAAASPTGPVSAGGYVRGGMLVIQDGATLPDRCIKCNAPAEAGRVTKRLAYNIDNSGPGAARFIPVVGRFVRIAWLIKRIATRQHVTVSYCLCPAHRTKQLVGTILAALAAPVGIGLIVLGKGDPQFIIIGIVILALGSAFGASMASALRVAAGLNNGAELKGAGKAFLASMPQPGTRPRRMR